MTTWACHPDGVHIWRDGQKVGVIPFDQFQALILACARELQNAR